MPDGAPDGSGQPTRPRFAQCTCHLRTPFTNNRHAPDCPRYDAGSNPSVAKEHLLRLYERLALVEAALALYADPMEPYDHGHRARQTLATARGWPPALDGAEQYGTRDPERPRTSRPPR